MRSVAIRTRAIRGLSVLALVAAGCSGDDSSDTSELSPLEVGACFDSPVPIGAGGFLGGESPELEQLDVVPCDGPHDGVIVAVDGTEEAFEDILFCPDAVDDFFERDRPAGVVNRVIQDVTRTAGQDPVFLTVCAALLTGATDGGVDQGAAATESAVSPGSAQTAPVTVTGAPLARHDPSQDDPSIGMPMPELAGVDFAGVPVVIAADGRAKIVMVVAHWDPHSESMIAGLAAQQATGALSGEVDRYLVSTFVSTERPNYPPSAWFSALGLDVPVLVDDPDGSAAAALGVGAVPTWVFVDRAGRVTDRQAGELTVAQLDELTSRLLASA